MIQQTVVIKSNKYGITLCLDKDIAFRDLLSQIAEKFKASAKFFGDAQMALSFEGRRLSESEQLEVVQTIQENTSLEILCIMEQDTLTEAYMKEVLEDRKKELSPVMANSIKEHFVPDRCWRQEAASLFSAM